MLYEVITDTSHYLPAYTKGIEEQQAEIDAIVNNPEPPDFENTILPYDKSGRLLRKVSSVFGSLNSANTNPGMQMEMVVGKVKTDENGREIFSYQFIV